MHDQAFQMTQTLTHTHAADLSPLNPKRAVCEAPTSVGEACQSKPPLFRRRLFVRLKANVISDTQQEPSEHQTAAKQWGKKAKQNKPKPQMHFIFHNYPKKGCLWSELFVTVSKWWKECVRGWERGGHSSPALTRRCDDVETTKIVRVMGEDWQEFPPVAFYSHDLKDSRKLHFIQSPGSSSKDWSGKCNAVGSSPRPLSVRAEVFKKNVSFSTYSLAPVFSPQYKRSLRCWLDEDKKKKKPTILYY